MARALAFARTVRADPAALLRTAMVSGCGLALAFAGPLLPL